MTSQAILTNEGKGFIGRAVFGDYDYPNDYDFRGFAYGKARNVVNQYYIQVLNIPNSVIVNEDLTYDKFREQGGVPITANKSLSSFKWKYKRLPDGGFRVVYPGFFRFTLRSGRYPTHIMFWVYSAYNLTRNEGSKISKYMIFIESLKRSDEFLDKLEVTFKLSINLPGI